MKKIVRLLILAGVVSFAAIPPALSATYGTCAYRCYSSTGSSQLYSYTTAYNQCCGTDRTSLCPSGMYPMTVSFNGAICI